MAINCFNLEKGIEGRIVSSLRAIFELDPNFRYNEDDIQTGVLITPGYPESLADNKKPHIVVTNIAYDVNMETTFNNNFESDIVENGIYVGRRHLNIIPYSADIISYAEYYESSDIANRIVSYITYVAKEAFDNVGIINQRVSKSPTAPSKQYPEHEFQTPIRLSGHVEWQGIKKADDPSLLTLLKRIDFYYQNL